MNDIDIHVEEHGSGPPLLLMPPTAWPGSVWDDALVPRLRDRFHVITYDQRGIGLSSHDDGAYTTTLLASDALGLLRAADAVPAHLFGFSTGGQIAQMMALDAPHDVRSLVLGASSARGPGSGIPLKLALRLIEDGYDDDYWLKHLTASDFPFTRAFRERHPEKVRALADAIDRRKPPLRTYLRHVIARGTHDARARLGEIRVPTRVVVGSDDHEGESGGSDHIETSRALARAIPGAELLTIDGAHHLFPWERPDETVELLAAFYLRQ